MSARTSCCVTFWPTRRRTWRRRCFLCVWRHRDVIVSTSSKHGNFESWITCSYKHFVYRRLFSNSCQLTLCCCVWWIFSNYSTVTIALNKFTRGRQSPESYPCSVGLPMQRTSWQLLLWKVGFGKLKSNGVGNYKSYTHLKSCWVHTHVTKNLLVYIWLLGTKCGCGFIFYTFI